jgi:hypothetical protein
VNWLKRLLGGEKDSSDFGRPNVQATSIHLNSSNRRPPDFQFPESFIRWLENEGPQELKHWKVLATEPGLADGWYRDVRGLYPARQLVPFAKVLGFDDIVCFDGESTEGNPCVHIVHAYADSGWEDRGSRPDFDSWLEEAREIERENPFDES